MKKEISTLTASAIDNHLKRNGWIRNEKFKNKKLMVYTRSNLKKGSSIAVPADEKLIGFYENIEPVLNTIAHFENKSIDTLLKEIKEGKWNEKIYSKEF